MNKILGVVYAFIVVVVFSANTQAQDKILTMSGKIINCKIIDDSQLVISYKTTNKRNKTKERMIHKSEVFSVIKNGDETVFYAKDDNLGDTFTIDETRAFIAGEADGFKYNTKRIEILGYALGSVAGYFSKANVIVVLLTPTLYTIYQYIPYIKIEEDTMSDMKYIGNDVYLRGYEINARGKRIRKAMKSSVIGSFAGAIIFRIIPFS